MKMLKKDAISFLDDARKDEVKGLKRHMEVNRIDVKIIAHHFHHKIN